MSYIKLSGNMSGSIYTNRLPSTKQNKKRRRNTKETKENGDIKTTKTTKLEANQARDQRKSRGKQEMIFLGQFYALSLLASIPS
jgi:hypothetical protein